MQNYAVGGHPHIQGQHGGQQNGSESGNLAIAEGSPGLRFVLGKPEGLSVVVSVG